MKLLMRHIRSYLVALLFSNSLKRHHFNLLLRVQPKGTRRRHLLQELMKCLYMRSSIGIRQNISIGKEAWRTLRLSRRLRSVHSLLIQIGQVTVEVSINFTQILSQLIRGLKRGFRGWEKASLHRPKTCVVFSSTTIMVEKKTFTCPNPTLRVLWNFSTRQLLCNH